MAFSLLVSVGISLTVDLGNFCLGPMKVLTVNLGIFSFAPMQVITVGLVLIGYCAWACDAVVISKLIRLTLIGYLAGAGGFAELVSKLSGSMSSMSSSFNNTANSSGLIP